MCLTEQSLGFAKTVKLLSLLVFMHRKQKRSSPITSHQLEGKLCSFYHFVPLHITALIQRHSFVTHGLQEIQTNKTRHASLYTSLQTELRIFFLTVLQ